MNTLLLVTAANHLEMKTFAENLAEKQEARVAGKLLVMGGYYLDETVLQSIGGPLADKFEVVELSKVQIGERTTNESQIATMLAVFFMQRYTTVPGAWLIADCLNEIVSENPISLIEHHFNAHQTENAGLATTLGGGRVPVGPVVVGSPVKALKTLRFVSGQDWRERAKWIFNIRSWYQFGPDEFPFRLKQELESPALTGGGAGSSAPGSTTIVAGLAEPPKPQQTLPVAKPRQQDVPGPKNSIESIAMPELSKEGSEEDLVERVALAQDSTPQEIYERQLKAKEEGGPLPGEPGWQPSEEMSNRPVPEVDPHPGSAIEDEEPPTQVERPADTPKARPAKLPFVRIEPDSYEKVSREVLIDQVAHRSGKQPHPQTGEKKLIEKLREMDKEAAAAGKQ